MKPGDTEEGTYTVAFRDGRFLMVRNDRRGGWEMPGGHIRVGETVEEGARREFLEEAGMDVEIIAVLDIGHCRMCAGIIADDARVQGEMEPRFFDELPEELSFPREEYLYTIPWARAEVEKRLEKHRSSADPEPDPHRFRDPTARFL